MVWAPPQCKMGTLEREVAVGTPLGISADGSASRRLKTPPPGLRRPSLLDVLPALSHPGQVGDACLGYSVTGRQSAPVALKRCVSAKSVIARVAGRASKGRGDALKDLDRSAKLGRCPRFVPPTQIAAPPPFSVGAWDDLKVRGVRPW